MRIQVLYFAVFRERIAQECETIELPADADVDAALAVLEERHDAIRVLRGRFRVAVNQTMVESTHRLVDGDELALIPPVAGGASGPKRHVALLREPLSLDRCISAVNGPEMGGIVTFTGTVRRYSRGQPVERLEYEAYDQMAINEMRNLCDEIEQEALDRTRTSPTRSVLGESGLGVRIAVEHRIGLLGIGDLAVVIAAAAPHRAEAFTACSAMIDRLKERVPIWKKEISTDGSAWVGLGP
jgi:molybdopterin synthase catalytic subunit